MTFAGEGDKRRHPAVEERTRNIAEWAEHASVNRIEPGKDYKLGIITGEAAPSV